MGDETRAALAAPIIVRWPSEQARRTVAVLDGRPCLLVLERGAAIPPLAANEDWVRTSADEQEVAARLARLASRGWAAPGPLPPVVPPAMGAAARRVLLALALAPGALVRRRDLKVVAAGPAADGPRPPGDLDRVLREVRAGLPAEWQIDVVPAVGYVLSHAKETR